VLTARVCCSTDVCPPHPPSPTLMSSKVVLDTWMHPYLQVLSMRLAVFMVSPNCRQQAEKHTGALQMSVSRP
jgi:hypothetical protein